MESVNEVTHSSLNDPRKTELLNISNLIDDSISTIWEEGFGFYCESDDDNLALFGVGGPA